MPSRFFVYPLIVLTLAQLTPLLRNDPRWFLVQIIQRAVILLIAGIALLDSSHVLWIFFGWFLYASFVVLPQMAQRFAMNVLAAGDTTQAAVAWGRVAMSVKGRPAVFFREITTALEHWNAGREEEAESILCRLADDASLPDKVRGEARLCHILVLAAGRYWERVVAIYETSGAWGTMASALQARLVAARGYAELGRISTAIQTLMVVSLSTRTVSALADQLWMMKICVAALAGDKDEMEWLLANMDRPRRRGLAGFVAAWRGRCARQRGEREEAGRQLARALSLVPASQVKSRAVLTGYLENMDVPVTVPDEPVRHGFALLRDVDQQMSPWRKLMSWNRPGRVTTGLLVLLSGIHLWNVLWVQRRWGGDLSNWLGNLPFIAHGEWWRPITAVFLHGGWLHLGLNSVALWMFGTAIEKSLGWFRMLVIFVVAGTVANIGSAYVGGFDVSVGASGGINGLLAAFGVTIYRLNAPIPATLKRRLLTVLGMLVLVDIAIGSMEKQIDNTAHLVGLLMGFLLGLVP